MTDHIQVAVDATNPGQFFACCGLLELAERLWPGAEGHFEGDAFRLECCGSLGELLTAMLDKEPEELVKLENGLQVKPLIAPLRLVLRGCRAPLILDAWMATRIDKGQVVAAANPPWNFWSGQQTSLRIWKALRAALLDQLSRFDAESSHALFSHLISLSGRFGFDPGAAWNALDVGFSPNEQGLNVASSPAVELLAAVGLQRFRPIVQSNRTTFDYATWGQPLPATVAATAAVGMMPTLGMCRYRGRVIGRGSYSALGQSIRLKGTRDE